MKKKESKKNSDQSAQPLFEVVIFALSIVLLIVGVHQTITVGFAKAYWIFMLMFCFLLLYTYKKGKRLMAEKEENPKKGQQ